ncbi:SDR family oxidoreductase [Halomarina ordinaria]|uniref:SDR family oxidoreductase n=1 Tax=Halomarina ordinaria TaxID=3033939 RepID=A0ABD5U4N1_9EURY|nr:SDR family oxidoreductase [Halomarina sp. PSRA2]
MSDETVLVAGASGRTGRDVVDALLDAGVEVRAHTRSPEEVETLELQGASEVVVGDLLDFADARAAVRGVDTVVCAVGTTLGLGALRGPLVDGKGVINLVDAATDEGVERFVLVSAIGVGDSREGMPRPFRAFLDLFGIVSAKERAEAHLRRSGLTYTVLRPGGLTDAPATGDVLVGEGGDTVSGTVPRADVARLALAALFTPESENRTFEVVSRAGRRGDVTGVVEVPWETPDPVANR